MHLCICASHQLVDFLYLTKQNYFKYSTLYFIGQTTLRNTVERTSINEYFELSSSIVSRDFCWFRNSSEKQVLHPLNPLYIPYAKDSATQCFETIVH